MVEERECTQFPNRNSGINGVSFMVAFFNLKYGLLDVLVKEVKVADLVAGEDGAGHGAVESLIKFLLRIGKERGRIRTSTFRLRLAV